MADTPTEALKAVEELKGNIARILDLEDQIKAGADAGKAVADLKQEVANLSVKNAELVDKAKDEVKAASTAHLEEMEAEFRKRFDAGRPGAAKSAGTRFVESDAFKGAHDRTAIKGVVVDRAAMKDITVGADVVPPNYTGELVRPQDTRLSMRDLIPGGRSAEAAIFYAKLTGRATAAAVVAEGALKPESDLTLVSATATMAVLAHYIPVTKQQLSDVDGLRSLIDAELEYGIEKVEDAAFLNGTGDIEGIIPQATAYAAATYGDTVTGATFLDHVRGMIAQLQVADYAPDGIVLNPVQWFQAETTKTTDGAYVFANPQNVAQPRLWGLPVVATNQMPDADVLVGAFRLGAQIFDGQLMGTYGIQIETGYVNDQFIRNQLSILAEERVALAVKRPGAFVYYDSDAVV